MQQAAMVRVVILREMRGVACVCTGLDQPELLAATRASALTHGPVAFEGVAFMLTSREGDWAHAIELPEGCRLPDPLNPKP